MKNSKFINWLNKPFPSYISIKQKIAIPIYFGIFVSLFLLIFLPFGIEKINLSQITNIISYGVVTTIIMLFFSIVFPKILPKFSNEENWTILKHIIFTLLHLLFIGIGNSLVSQFFEENITEKTVFVVIIISLARTISLGIFPVIILTFWLERKLMKKHQKIAKKTSEKLNKSNKPQQKTIKISSQNNKEVLEINTNNLICIKAEGNYCKIFIEKKNIEKKILRVTMKKLETELLETKSIVRCHKSYFVNLNKINEVTGNASGYTFLINNLDFSIPVSRNLSKNILDSISIN